MAHTCTLVARIAKNLHKKHSLQWNRYTQKIYKYFVHFIHSFAEVYILFEGEAKVRWDERKSKTYHGRTRYYTEYYRGRHTYQSSKTTVFGSGDMAPGTYTYNFSIPLPLECPSSMVTKYGKIFYEVSVVIDRQWKFNNIFKQPLTVLQTYNLNMNPELLVTMNTNLPQG